jgi:hypothetical protein
VRIMCTKSSSICVLRRFLHGTQVTCFFPMGPENLPKMACQRLDVQQILVAATNRLWIFEHCGQGSKLVL